MTNAFCSAGVLSSYFSLETASKDMPLNFEIEDIKHRVEGGSCLTTSLLLE